MKDHEPAPTDQPAFASPLQPALTDPAGWPKSDRATELACAVLGIAAPAATRILERAGGPSSLTYASEAELIAAGVPRRRIPLLRNAFELARLAIGERPRIGARLADAPAVWHHLRARLAGLPVEEFWVIALNVRHRVLFDEMVARGSLTGVEIHPRDVFRKLIRAGAAAAIFCHNHPSGDPSPSRADIELTDRLRQVGDTCGIAVLDHVVVGSEGYVSLASHNWR